MKHKKILEIKNNLKINNGRDFWKSLILENLINIYEQGDNENFKIENKLCKEGNVYNNYIDNETRFFDGYEALLNGDKYLYSYHDDKTNSFIPVYEDDDFNIYAVEEFKDDI